MFETLSPPYRTIVADPPWPINWTGGAAIGLKNIAYPTMTIAEIVLLPVADIAHESANLYLWTTNAFLPEALGVVRAWGFRLSDVVDLVQEQRHRWTPA